MTMDLSLKDHKKSSKNEIPRREYVKFLCGVYGCGPSELKQVYGVYRHFRNEVDSMEFENAIT